jgi:hypothetical protein
VKECEFDLKESFHVAFNQKSIGHKCGMQIKGVDNPIYTILGGST